MQTYFTLWEANVKFPVQDELVFNVKQNLIDFGAVVRT